MNLLIRPETVADHAAVRSLLVDAFGSTTEPDGVERIRELPSMYVPDLALVGIIEPDVVGHVMLSYGTLTGDHGTRPALMLSPLAVAPAWQRRGIGRALVESSLAAAAERGEPLVVLQGSPDYYGARGFEDARTHGIGMELPDWAPREAGQVFRLPAYDTGDPALRGWFSHPPVSG